MTRSAATNETVMKLTDTKQQLSQVINRVARGETRIVVEKSGLPVAAIISTEDLQEYKQLKERDQERRDRFFERLARLGDAFDGVSDEELEREILNAQSEVKADLARERQQG